MSKSELWKGVSIRLVTAIVFGVLGYFAVITAVEMVAIFGEGMGIDVRSKAIYARGHVIVHLFGAACSLAIGIFVWDRSKFLACLAILGIAGAGSYGIVNMVGFTATNRVSVAAAKDAKNIAAERQYEAARTDLMQQIDWLQKTAAEEFGRERRRLLSQVDAKRKELSALKPPVPTAETVLADPQATVFARMTGTDPETWKMNLPVPLAILLFIAECFSFLFVGHMLGSAFAMGGTYLAQRKPKGNKTADGGNSDGNGDGNGGKVVQLHKPEPSTAALPAAQNSTASAFESAAPSAASTRRSDRPVASITPVQLPWSKADVDAYLAEVAGRPKRQTWREMAHMMGWDHTTLFKRWQRSTGVDKGRQRPALGNHRTQHRQERHAQPRPC